MGYGEVGSARAVKPASALARVYSGKTNQKLATSDPKNVFTVTIQLNTKLDFDSFVQAAGNVTTFPSSVTFTLKVRNEPGQVHVTWPD